MAAGLLGFSIACMIMTHGIFVLASPVQTWSQACSTDGHPHSNKTCDCQCNMAVH